MAAFDIRSPQQMGAVVRRLTNFAESLPEQHIEAGKIWYPQAHDVAQRAGREFGTSTRSAAGMVAALSAGTEWGQNQSAFHDLMRMTPEHEETIRRSSVESQRTPEVKNLLETHYPNLTVSTDRNIGKALDIHRGADPEDVLSRRDAPKTNSFFRNILNPGGPEVTVDFRAFDLVSNEMRPSRDYNRGISSAELTRRTGASYQPQLSRFERVADVYNALGNRGIRGFTRGNQAQAALWVAGKDIELSRPLKDGGQRTTGIPRRGEAYMTPKGDPIDMGHLNWDQLR